jgi:hypothetical protein
MPRPLNRACAAMPPPLVERFYALGCALRTRLGRPLLGAAFAEVYGMVELSGPAIIRVTPPRLRAGRLSARLVEAAERVRRLAARVFAPARLAACGCRCACARWNAANGAARALS